MLDGLEAQHQYDATLDKQPAQDFDWTDNADRQQCEREDKPTTEANKPAKQPQKETTRTGFRLLPFINGREGPSWAMPH